jgi:hypothetical protein
MGLHTVKPWSNLKYRAGDGLDFNIYVSYESGPQRVACLKSNLYNVTLYVWPPNHLPTMPNFLSSILSLSSGRDRKTGSQGNYLFLNGPATQVKGGVRSETANSWVPLSPNSSYDDMDNELRTITEKVFEELRARERDLGLRVLSWHLITSTFQNCPALYSDRTAEVEKYRQLPTARPSVWTSLFINGSAEANASIVRKVSLSLSFSPALTPSISISLRLVDG